MSKKTEPLITRVEIFSDRWKRTSYAVYGEGLHGAVIGDTSGTRPGTDCPAVEDLIGLTYYQAKKLLNVHYYRVYRTLHFYERALAGITQAQKSIEKAQAYLKKRTQKAASYGEEHTTSVAEMKAFRDACLKINKR